MGTQGPRPGRRQSTLLVAVLAVSGLLGGTACSGSADSEEVSDLASVYTASKGPLGVPLPEEQAECRARVYLESDLSDKALNDVRAGKPPRPHTQDDVEVLAELATKLAECLDP